MKIILICVLGLFVFFGDFCKPKPQPPPPPPPSPSTPEPTLRSAKITFSLPEGDDKDDNSKMSVTVTSKVNNQFDQRIASLEDFGDQQTWEDDGSKSYAYDLNVVGGTKLSTVSGGGIKTKLEFKANGDDRVYFNYRLVLIFDDNDSSTAPVELEQTNPSLIEMSETKRTYTNP